MGYAVYVSQKVSHVRLPNAIRTFCIRVGGAGCHAKQRQSKESTNANRTRVFGMSGFASTGTCTQIVWPKSCRRDQLCREGSNCTQVRGRRAPFHREATSAYRGRGGETRRIGDRGESLPMTTITHIQSRPDLFRDQKNPAHRVELIREAFGHREASTIRPWEIEDWLTKLSNRKNGRPLKPGTVNRMKAHLSAIYQHGKLRDKGSIQSRPRCEATPHE